MVADTSLLLRFAREAKVYSSGEHSKMVCANAEERVRASEAEPTRVMAEPADAMSEQMSARPEPVRAMAVAAVAELN